MTNVKKRVLKLIRRLELLDADTPDHAVTERHLWAVLGKYGLTLDDFTNEAEELTLYVFEVSNNHEYELIIGVCRSALRRQIRLSDRHSFDVQAGQCHVELLPSEFPEVNMIYQVCKQRLAETLTSALFAFMAKNDLIVELPDDAEQTSECNIDIEQARKFIAGMNKVRIHKALTHE